MDLVCPTVSILDTLEQELGKPVISAASANHVAGAALGRSAQSRVRLRPAVCVGAHGLLPSPLWGGVGGGVVRSGITFVKAPDPPPPALPHKGEGVRLSVPHALSTFHRNAL